MQQKIRWGIVGLGKIAHSFAKDLALVSDAELVAAASRSQEKADSFANIYGTKYAFASYGELFQCDAVDVVYIATPHNSHAKWAINAMEHHKAVLCEKPMGVNTAQVQKMVACAKANGVFLMEALWSRFNPTIKKVKELVGSGIIGPVRYLNADFSFYALDRSEKGRILNPALAGGSILDIGIYPIFLSYLLLGKPKEIQVTSIFHHTGAEIQTAMVFGYPDAQAVLYSGFASHAEMKVKISGEKGCISILPRWHEAESFSLDNENGTEVFTIPKNGKGYTYEIEEVQRCLRDRKLQSTLWSHQNSLDLIQLLDSVRSKAGVVLPFEK